MKVLKLTDLTRFCLQVLIRPEQIDSPKALETLWKTKKFIVGVRFLRSDPKLDSSWQKYTKYWRISSTLQFGIRLIKMASSEHFNIKKNQIEMNNNFIAVA